MARVVFKDEFDPTKPATEKLNVEPAEPAEVDVEAVKARIAEKVRADSTERHAVTPEHVVLELAGGLPRQRVSEVLAEMGSEERYGDVKAVVAPTGRVYLFCESRLAWIEAQDQARREEAKLAIVEKIRNDSRAIVLTAAADLEPLYPMPEPEAREALLAELLADPRFQDVRAMAGPAGARFYHSDAYISGNYGKIMMRAKAMTPVWAIAEFVRDRARIIPAPTKLSVFEDPVFLFDPKKIAAFIVDLLATKEYADIKKLVHPKTGAVYLYSDRFLSEELAFRSMDWDEVGAIENP